MLDAFRRLMKLIDKYDSQFEDIKLEKPLMIPPEIYDEICDAIKQDYISLFGLS